MSLAGKVCLVTGATRGIGKGIALQLGEAGATVYVTGRTLKAPSSGVGGSLEDTAKEIEQRGGRCIPVQCDHSKDDDIEQLFKRIEREQDGQLDVLVNNAYAAVHTLMNTWGKKFYEIPPTVWDDVNNVGLRNHYVCSVYAARMMVPRKRGLIVNISSGGGLRYLFSIAYGVGKQAVDRLAADVAFELKEFDIASVSLWPGAVKTENIMGEVEAGTFKDNKKLKDMFVQGETPEFSGKCIVRLATDPNIMKKTGKILLTADLGDEYDLTDEGGRRPGSFRSIQTLLEYAGFERTAAWVPRWLKIPGWMMAISGSKF